MSRRDRISSPPASGINHRIHGLRSFTEIVALGDFDTPEAPITDYDLGNFSYAGKSFATLVGGPDYGWTISRDGLHLYVANNNNDTLYHHALTTAWDLNTAQAFDASFNYGGTLQQGAGFAVSDDGKRFWISCRVQDAVYQFTMSTAHTLGTMAYATKSLNVVTQTTEPRNISVDPSETYFLICDADSGQAQLHLYTASTPGDIGTASHTATLDVYGVGLGQTTSIAGADFSFDGTKVYITDDGGDEVHQYSVSPAYTGLATATFDGAGSDLDLSGETTVPRMLRMSPNGVTAFVGDDSTDLIYAYQSSVTATPDSGVSAATSASVQMTNTIPRGAMVVRVFVEVIEGFQGDTTAVAVVGDADDEDRYVVASFDVKAQGVKQTGKPSGEKFHKEPKKPKVKVTSGNAFGNLTGGLMQVTVAYVEP